MDSCLGVPHLRCTEHWQRTTVRMDMSKADSVERGQQWNWTTVQMDNILKADFVERGHHWNQTTVQMDMMKTDSVERGEHCNWTTVQMDTLKADSVERGQHWNWTTVQMDIWKQTASKDQRTILKLDKRTRWKQTAWKEDSIETGQQYKCTTYWKQTAFKADRTGRGQQWNTATCWKRPVLYIDDTESRLSFNAWDISGTTLVLFKVFTLTSLTAKRLEDYKSYSKLSDWSYIPCAPNTGFKT